MRDFYRKLNPKLREEFEKKQTYSTIQKVYRIVIEPKTMNLFARRFGKIDPADVELAVKMMAKLNAIVCDGLLFSMIFNKEIIVATRVQEHEDVERRLEEQKEWGGNNKIERKIRKEFEYKKVKLTNQQVADMVDNTIRQSTDQLLVTLNQKDHGCKIIEKLYIDNFLAGSGLTEEQYEQIMQDADKESADAELMARLVAEANARMAARDNVNVECVMNFEADIVDKVLAEKMAEKSNKKSGRNVLDCGLSIDDVIGEI